MGGRVIVQQEKKTPENRMKLDKPDEGSSGGDPLLLYKILHLLFFSFSVRIPCALRLESRKKYQPDLDAGPFGI